MRHAILLYLVFAASGGIYGEDWPQWQGAHRNGEWHETGLLEKFPQDGAKILWRTPVGLGYSGPAVVNGKVYVFDYTIKNGGSAGGKAPHLQGDERLLCLNAADGQQLWEYKYACEYNISYPNGPRATPTVSGGKVYALGAEGMMTCLDAEKGGMLWQRNLRDEYKVKTPMWGFASHPLVDGKKLICILGGKDSVALALDKDSGAEIWKALNAEQPGYSAPSIIEAAGVRQLLIWSAEALNGLDPETGKVYWSVPIAATNGMSIMMPVRSGDVVYVGGRSAKGVAVKLDPAKPDAKVLWRAEPTTGLFIKTCGAVVDGEYMYGVCENGEMRCVEVATGKRLWESYAPVAGVKAGSGAAYIVKNGARYIIFSEKGDLIFATMSPKGYAEISRAHILEPTADSFGRPVVWSHPAFADKKCFARNDKEIVCVNLAAD